MIFKPSSHMEQLQKDLAQANQLLGEILTVADNLWPRHDARIWQVDGVEEWWAAHQAAAQRRQEEFLDLQERLIQSAREKLTPEEFNALLEYY